MVIGEKIADCYCVFRDRKDVKPSDVGIFENKYAIEKKYKCGLGNENCSLLKLYNERPENPKSRAEIEKIVKETLVDIATPKISRRSDDPFHPRRDEMRPPILT
jgi:hypothetical protein